MIFRHALSACALLACVLAGSPCCARAQESQRKELLPVAVAVNTPAEELKARIGKQVTVLLVSGQEISGVVEAVGDSAVRIGQLAGKEFYSAVIRLGDVGGVIYRAK